MNVIARLERYKALVVPVAFISLLMVIVVPLPTMIMDMLLVTNLSLGAIMLLTTLFVEKPLGLLVVPVAAAGHDAVSPGAEHRDHAFDPLGRTRARRRRRRTRRGR